MEFDQQALPRFFETHVARFATAGRASNLAKPERQAFLSGLAELLSGTSWMVLTRLLVDGEPVAWNYGFEFAGSWFYYQPTFDAGLQQFSPGFCLLTKMVEQACERPEIRLLDLGLGEESYKARFATGYRPDSACDGYYLIGGAAPGDGALSRGIGGQVVARGWSIGCGVWWAGLRRKT